MFPGYRRVIYLQQFMFRQALLRKSVPIGIAGLAFYLLFLPKKYEITFTGNVPESDPAVVWDFLSDFSNMKKLNPTMIDFTITSDKATPSVWEYGVRYSEYLSNLPFIRHSADATIKSYKVFPVYFVESNHATCFIGNFFCLNTSSKIKCSIIDSGAGKTTFVQEDNVYECPRLAYFFCLSEIVYQRTAVFKNLIKHFENTKY
ncbi:uncharacterized protein LOC106664065 [Cimex lectularius]|uniref:Uncharacterized protein n=1 Tax=Cimex lectularius TaxID=79782 RepID=A0A8I6RGI3_CIMLE|nr:uncharacterized protein LOC106664065 [Cimex lectularius]